MKIIALLGLLTLAKRGHAKVRDGPSCYRLTDGWVKGTDNFKYRCSMEEKSFPEAKDTCKKLGANLVMEKEGETRNFVLKMYSNKSIWIGVKRDKQTKKFMYVDGSNITTTHWTKKGPGNEDCVHHSGTKNEWSTDSCSKKKLFLCQKKINHGCTRAQARAAMIQISSPGFHIPDCKNDNSYSAKQCKGIRCWCVKKGGEVILGSMRHKKLPLDCDGERKSSSKCQRRAQVKKGFKPKCDPNGDFSAHQCFDSNNCWCSMPDGIMIPKTRFSETQKDKPNCAKHRGLTFNCDKKLGTFSHPFDKTRFIYCSHLEPYTQNHFVNVFACKCPSDLIYPKGSQRFCQREGEFIDEDPCAHDNGGCDGRATRVGDKCICSCPKGWKLLADKKTCAPAPKHPCDIANGGCQHICQRVGRKSKCACRKGFVLMDDKKSCRDKCKLPCLKLPSAKEKNQVCGSDGKTCLNMCVFEARKCELAKKGFTLKIISKGECPVHIGCCRKKDCSDYRGSLYITRDGDECLRWDTHPGKLKPDDKAGLNSNHCRNVKGFNGDGKFHTDAWCFTKKGKGICKVPMCKP